MKHMLQGMLWGFRVGVQAQTASSWPCDAAHSVIGRSSVCVWWVFGMLPSAVDVARC